MRDSLQACGAALKTVFLLAVIGFGISGTAAQTQSPKTTSRPAATNASPASEADQEHLAATRKELIDLLRMNPKMVSFVKRDPLLLGDQEYVNRTNPKLAEFLKVHPEIARNPEFYLFAEIANQGGIRDMYIDESEWIPKQESKTEDVLLGGVAFTVFVVILSVLVWLLRVLLENRRWNRVFKVQTDIYNKLLDKFSSNEEMLAYIRSESGKRFLDSATLPFGTGMQPQIPNPVARVLTPLQLGIVLAVVGLGLNFLRSRIPDAVMPLSVFGTLSLMAGIGFIISAGLAYGLARHLGMLPQSATPLEQGPSQHPEIP